MKTFAFDLKVARRKAGLTQGDCAHLLGISQSRVSDFETGKLLPDLKEFTMLSLIYGTRFEGLFAALATEVCRDLRKRLASISETRGNKIRRFTRGNTLQSLADRLAAINVQQYGETD